MKVVGFFPARLFVTKLGQFTNNNKTKSYLVRGLARKYISVDTGPHCLQIISVNTRMCLLRFRLSIGFI